jgi:hypothetical protein
MIFGIIASTLSAAPAPAGDTVIAVFAGQSNMTAFETTGSDVPVDLGGTDSGVRIWNTHTSTSGRPLRRSGDQRRLSPKHFAQQTRRHHW